jgi:hypothetical protein
MLHWSLFESALRTPHKGRHEGVRAYENWEWELRSLAHVGGARRAQRVLRRWAESPATSCAAAAQYRRRFVAADPGSRAGELPFDVLAVLAAQREDAPGTSSSVVAPPPACSAPARAEGDGGAWDGACGPSGDAAFQAALEAFRSSLETDAGLRLLDASVAVMRRRQKRVLEAWEAETEEHLRRHEAAMRAPGHRSG